jgi:hypothetical protein
MLCAAPTNARTCASSAQTGNNTCNSTLRGTPPRQIASLAAWRTACSAIDTRFPDTDA